MQESIEQVFGVDTERLLEITGPVTGFQGTDLSLRELCRTLEEVGYFRPRNEVEEDPSFQQLIPYVVLTCGPMVLLLERTARGGEARLHGKLSIGVGGHVNPEPPGPEPLLVRGLRREVCEEIDLPDSGSLEPALLGFIRDPSNAVGRVHFGLACRIELPEPVAIREKETLIGRWVAPSELTRFEERMETWSRALQPSIGDRKSVV